MQVGGIVKKVISIAFLSATTAAAAWAALCGAGIAAAAPDVVGMKYSDAQQEIEDSGGTAVIATRVGDKLEEGDCIVTNAWDSSFLRIAEPDSDEISVALNCAGEYATATNPGASVASPEGRQAKSEAEEEAAKQEEQELENPVTPDE
ncbi:PASTA domain-containing protein [Mycobacterium sp. IS-3022]|uniref:PASTA domain-containing protein n=1 Tax=Mycobacterium sp. IS-3022 TaxID=1772277 RepID=UPI000741699B|nr:PASTA domain-containing protein [Mycobacterium sp. IS-3022]KUI05998.1 hypothetical protein AU188_02620 [Mycobacterium sp. IS-3022]